MSYDSFLLQTGTAVAAADAAANFAFAVGDYNRDGIADVYCLKKTNTGTGRLEVHVLAGASNYQAFLLQTGTPIAEADAAANFAFAVGDFNRDGTPDLFCLKRSNTGTRRLEVHVLSGASKYQTFLLQTGTPILEADAAENFAFAVGDYNRDGLPDLICIKWRNTGSGRLEVHVLSGASKYQTFLLQTGTPITQADAANFAFAAGDFNRDGAADLYCFKKTHTGTGTLEVHVLSGANAYQSFLLQTGTAIAESDAAANFAFGVGDYNRDGALDVFCLKKTNTGTGKLEAHVLDGASVLLNFSMQSQTQTNWCWAAVSTSVSHFYDTASAWTQCSVANAELGQTTCCAHGSSAACNVAWYLDRALTRVGRLEHWSSGAQSSATIMTQLRAGHPVGARIGWSGGGGHFVVINGDDADATITVSDPIYGTSHLALATFTSDYQGSGSWTDTYYTK